MPEFLDSLGSFAFYNCESLLSIEIPNGIRELKHASFRNCKALGFVSLPSSLEMIGKQAFEGCKSLSDLQFPKQLHTIEEYAFRSCEKLSTVVVEKEGVHGEPGLVLSADAKKGIFTVACGEGILGVTALVPEGKGKMNAGDFIRGRKIDAGDCLLTPDFADKK